MKLKGYKRHLAFATAQVLLLGLFMCLVSCQRDEDTNLYDNGRFMIQPQFSQAGLTVSTRANLSGYSTLNPADVDLIYAWAKENTTGTTADTLVAGEFRGSGSNWYSNVEVESGKSYYMFAYNPGGISSERGTFERVNQNTQQYRLTVNPINVITLGDPSISVAAARSEYQENLDAYSEPTLVPGNFNLGTISSNLNRDKALLAMNHLYSRAEVSFTLDTAYSNLRTIVIKSVKILAPQGSSSMNFVFGANPTVNFNTTYTGDSIEIELLQPNDSIVLNASNTAEWNGNQLAGYIYQSAGKFCYLPKSNLPLKLKVIYDVYNGDTGTDSLTNKNYNKRIARKNQPVTNSAIKFYGGTTPEAGTSYPVKINIKPSYLYVLTDDDLKIWLTID